MTHSQTRTLPRRLLLVAMALAVATASWFATPRLLGDESFDGIPAAQEASEAPSEEPTADATGPATIDELPTETYQVFLARDPFQPVVPAGVAGGDGTGGDGTGGDGTGGDGTGGDGTGGDGTTNPGDPLCNTGSNSATCEGLTVTLLDVTDDANGTRIIVQVDDTLYEVTVGSVFAGSFQVMSITAPCADLLYGDDMFTLCQGDRVLK